MPSVLPGIVGVVLITLVAGGIAYIGDRVGHQVGRKRLTMFGLRPKYTSTIVAVGTGMVIALSVTLIALIVSSAVRTAFFRIGELNSQINELQSQALAQRNELDTTRNGNIVLTAKAPIAPATLIDLSRPDAEQLRAFARFFDETVASVNRTYANANYGLAPYRYKSSDPAIRANLVRQLQLARGHEAALGVVGAPALFIPIASTNLFRGETITLRVSLLGRRADRPRRRRDRRHHGRGRQADRRGRLRPPGQRLVPRAGQARLPVPLLRLAGGRLRPGPLQRRQRRAGPRARPLPAGRALRDPALPAHRRVRAGRLGRTGARLMAAGGPPPATATILGLDPGTRKCGFALVRGLGTPPLGLGVIPLEQLEPRLRELLAATPVELAAIGRGTNAGPVAEVARRLGLRVELVDEYETTLRARARYFRDHPPRGWRALVPRGMLLPERPIDDYAALLIAERFLKGS